jgi:hypothetical protein
VQGILHPRDLQVRLLHGPTSSDWLVIPEIVMAEDNRRQGRPHTVVVTVWIPHALDARDALALALAGAGELVNAVVTDAEGETGQQELTSTVHLGRLH